MTGQSSLFASAPSAESIPFEPSAPSSNVRSEPTDCERSASRSAGIDATALIRAKRAKHPNKFEDLVKHYRKRGFSDAEIVRAMVESRLMISTVR